MIIPALAVPKQAAQEGKAKPDQLKFSREVQREDKCWSGWKQTWLLTKGRKQPIKWTNEYFDMTTHKQNTVSITTEWSGTTFALGNKQASIPKAFFNVKGKKTSDTICEKRCKSLNEFNRAIYHQHLILLRTRALRLFGLVLMPAATKGPTKHPAKPPQARDAGQVRNKINSLTCKSKTVAWGRSLQRYNSADIKVHWFTIRCFGCQSRSRSPLQYIDVYRCT